MVSMMEIKPMSILLIKIDFCHLCHLINLCYKRYLSQWEREPQSYITGFNHCQ